ncbi:MAG TPA: tRNA lysidine(34) synthetase TilS [Gemmatimonas aurantiaca]|nr:tRNA lysidine(34) synthetase TilS [Gemmatimonas aurantiaca]
MQLTKRTRQRISPGMALVREDPDPDMPADGIPEGIPAEDLLRASIEVALAAVREPLVLAVSGGSDSMALLFAMERWAPDRIAAVATFDHGTGSYATDAASLVAAHGRRLGLTVIRERARRPGVNEAAWRDARWSFLQRVARGFHARVATAHTRDDQAETVVMRLLRGSGARGLAALAAPSPVVRPWLGVSREELTRWLASEGLPFLEDPMNASRYFLRARVRHELLPACEAASPGFRDAMLLIGERAARWRREVEQYLDQAGLVVEHAGRSASLPVEVLEQTTPEGQAVLWAALSARAGVTLDAHGTRAAVRFTSSRRRGAYITVAGGAAIMRTRRAAEQVASDVGADRGIRAPAGVGERFVVRSRAAASEAVEWSGESTTLPRRLGQWRFRRLAAAPAAFDAWHMGLPAGTSVVVRPWREGDRIRSAGAAAGRRVTRYFTESRIPVPDRSQWPVVLVDDEVAWVPGVCRGLAAPSRSGRSELIWYRCEREFD